MASEDLFEEDFSEEIITQLEQDYVGNVEIADEEVATNEQEDNREEETAVEQTEEVDSTAATNTEEQANGKLLHLLA